MCTLHREYDLDLDPDISVGDLFARAREVHEKYERNVVDNDLGWYDYEAEFSDEDEARDYHESFQRMQELHAFAHWPKNVVVDTLKGIVYVQKESN